MNSEKKTSTSGPWKALYFVGSCLQDVGLRSLRSRVEDVLKPPKDRTHTCFLYFPQSHQTPQFRKSCTPHIKGYTAKELES